jgi:hypothetical protein
MHELISYPYILYNTYCISTPKCQSCHEM